MESGETDDILQKYEYVLDLIRDNINKARNLKNFDAADYAEDKKVLFELKLRYQITKSKVKEDLMTANRLYTKHIKLSKLMS